MVAVLVAVSVAVAVGAAVALLLVSGVGRFAACWEDPQAVKSKVVIAREASRVWGLGIFIGLGALSCDVFVQGFGLDLVVALACGVRLWLGSLVFSFIGLGWGVQVVAGLCLGVTGC